MTNATHKFLSVYLSLFLTLYMFRAHRAHHEERQIVSLQPLVTVTLCRWSCRVKNKNKYLERNLWVTLVIYQESLHDAGSTKYKIKKDVLEKHSEICLFNIGLTI